MKKLSLTILMLSSVFISLSSHGQPSEVISDGFSEEAEAYLKKNPNIDKCANNMAK